MDLSGSVALVTGGALRIGRSVSLALGRLGADVAVHYLTSDEEAREVARELESLGVSGLPVSGQLANPADIEAMFGAVEERFGRLDVLVNSAAGFRRQEIARISAQDWDEVLAVNLRAPFLLSRRAAGLMSRSDRRANRPGLIVNMADLSGEQAWLNYAHHSVSKAGLLHLTSVLARELAPGVRVNAIVPGPILPPPGMSVESDEWQAAGDRIPLKRTGQPKHIAQTVAFLAKNDFVTGAVIHVDGGEHLIGPRGR